MAFEVFPPVALVARALSTYPGRWGIGGGWAADCWLGRQTRDDADIDVITFEHD
ncbi:MAG: nucleotidyltransferase domain-containing protein [Hyphomicrobiales bacterium]